MTERPTSAHPDTLTLLRRLVETPSVNPGLEAGGTGEAAVAALTSEWLRSWGYQVETHEFEPGRTSVVARRSRGGRGSLLLNGHLDTVGVQGMSGEPFGATVRGGRLHGRGSADMKAGVAVVLAAAAAAAADERVTGELIVVLNADEEDQSRGMRQLLEAGLRADAAVVTEPTGLAIMPAHKGFAWVEVVFQGRAAHGSRPELGVDAVRHAGHFIARLDELEDELATRPPHPLLGRGTLHVGTIHGGVAPSVYPASCRVVLERRTLPATRPESTLDEFDYVLGRLRSSTPRLQAATRIVFAQPGSELPTEHPLVRDLMDALEAEELEPRIAGMTAWVEAALLNAAGIPALCFGPGDIADAHTADESVELAQLEPARRVLGRLIRTRLSTS